MLSATSDPVELFNYRIAEKSVWSAPMQPNWNRAQTCCLTTHATRPMYISTILNTDQPSD